ncbi:pentapeptide repeat-containing protein [Agrobacterium vitis]|uniref:pentapeptide repeat-containing protein n=1 Tax=Agrobacterium vitis TaxID=373 RepID=UPI0012E965E8|nr:pentapeptide repeat-containing protein [Agrobacterium vitis]MVA25943.1 pentapeptide repeat-containing protein [Agrobacterium vitis]
MQFALFQDVKNTARLASCLFSLVVVSMLGTSVAQAADCRSGPASKVDWSECRKRQLMLGGSDLRAANLYDADLSFTDLSNSSLQAADLEKATLIRASFAGANADGAKFDRIESYRAEMSAMSGVDATFISAEMQRVNLAGANLAGADFTKAELSRVNFEKSILMGAKFTLANLSRASFNFARLDGGVDFEDAFLFRTRIEGVDLSTAKGLKQEQVNLACGDAKTKLPAGLTNPSDWPCPAD